MEISYILNHEKWLISPLSRISHKKPVVKIKASVIFVITMKENMKNLEIENMIFMLT